MPIDLTTRTVLGAFSDFMFLDHENRLEKLVLCRRRETNTSLIRDWLRVFLKKMM